MCQYTVYVHSCDHLATGPILTKLCLKRCGLGPHKGNVMRVNLRMPYQIQGCQDITWVDIDSTCLFCAGRHDEPEDLAIEQVPVWYVPRVECQGDLFRSVDFSGSNQEAGTSASQATGAFGMTSPRTIPRRSSVDQTLLPQLGDSEATLNDSVPQRSSEPEGEDVPLIFSAVTETRDESEAGRKHDSKPDLFHSPDSEQVSQIKLTLVDQHRLGKVERRIDRELADIENENTVSFVPIAISGSSGDASVSSRTSLFLHLAPAPLQPHSLHSNTQQSTVNDLQTSIGRMINVFHSEKPLKDSNSSNNDSKSDKMSVDARSQRNGNKDESDQNGGKSSTSKNDGESGNDQGTGSKSDKSSNDSGYDADRSEESDKSSEKQSFSETGYDGDRSAGSDTSSEKKSVAETGYDGDIDRSKSSSSPINRNSALPPLPPRSIADISMPDLGLLRDGSDISMVDVGVEGIRILLKNLSLNDPSDPEEDRMHTSDS